jgi:TP901 family phage tail tape measure protein
MITNANKAWGAFGFKLKQIGAIGGLTAKQTDALGKAVRKMGPTMGTSASEMLDAAQPLASAGLEFNKVTALTPQVVKLAATRMGTYSKTARVLASALDLYNIKASEADLVSSKIAQTISTTFLDSVDELSDAWETSASASAAAKQPLEDMLMTVAILQKKTINASRTGIAFRRMLTNLAGPTKAQADGIKDIGLTLKEVNPAFVRLRDILFALAKTKLASREGLGLAKQIFGVRQGFYIKAMVDFIAENTERVKKAFEEMDSMDRTKLAKEFASQMDTMGGSIRSLTASWNEFKLSYGEAMEPGVRPALDQLSREFLGKGVTGGFFARIGAAAGAIIAERRVGRGIRGGGPLPSSPGEFDSILGQGVARALGAVALRREDRQIEAIERENRARSLSLGGRETFIQEGPGFFKEGFAQISDAGRIVINFFGPVITDNINDLDSTQQGEVR